MKYAILTLVLATAALDGVYPVTLTAYQTPDDYFGLPRDFQTIVLYYKKDMFDTGGLPYPTADWTWDDLRANALKLTLDKDADGRTDQWGFSADGYGPEAMIAPMIRAYGGDLVDVAARKTMIDSPEAAQAFALMHDMFATDDSMPNEQEVATGNSAGFVISKDTKSPDTAFAFVKFATSVEGQTLAAKIGLAVPIRETVATSPAYLHQPSARINHALFVDALAYAQPLPVFRGYEEWSTALGDNLHLVWTDQMTPEDGIAEALAAGDDALSKSH